MREKSEYNNGCSWGFALIIAMLFVSFRQSYAEPIITVILKGLPSNPPKGIPVSVKSFIYTYDGKCLGACEELGGQSATKVSDSYGKIEFFKEDLVKSNHKDKNLRKFAGLVYLNPQDIPKDWYGTGGIMFVHFDYVKGKGGPNTVSYSLVHKDFFHKIRSEIVFLHGMAAQVISKNGYFSDLSDVASFLDNQTKNWGNFDKNMLDIRVYTPMFGEDDFLNRKRIGYGRTDEKWFEEAKNFLLGNKEKSGPYNIENNIEIESDARHILLVGHSAGGRVLTRLISDKHKSIPNVQSKIRAGITVNSPQSKVPNPVILSKSSCKLIVSGVDDLFELACKGSNYVPFIFDLICDLRETTISLLEQACENDLTLYALCVAINLGTNAAKDICSELVNEGVETLQISNWQKLNNSWIKTPYFYGFISSEDNDDNPLTGGKACNYIKDLVDVHPKKLDDNLVPVDAMTHKQSTPVRYGTDTFTFAIGHAGLDGKFCHSGFKLSLMTAEVLATHIKQVILGNVRFISRYPLFYSEALKDFRYGENDDIVDFETTVTKFPYKHVFAVKDLDVPADDGYDEKENKKYFLKLENPIVNIDAIWTGGPPISVTPVVVNANFSKPDNSEITVEFSGKPASGTVIKAKVCLTDTTELKSCKIIRVIYQEPDGCILLKTAKKIEVCFDKMDNDCDGLTDEADCKCLNGSLISDASSSTPEKKTLWKKCDEKGDFVPVPSEVISKISVNLKEICDDGKDNDDDGQTDEDGCFCEPKKIEKCVTEDGCYVGTRTCTNEGVWSDCITLATPEKLKDLVEICLDGKDNNCDGITDEEDCRCIDGTSSDCYVGGDVCHPGYKACVQGSWGDCIEYPVEYAKEIAPEWCFSAEKPSESIDVSPDEQHLDHPDISEQQVKKPSKGGGCVCHRNPSSILWLVGMMLMICFKRGFGLKQKYFK